MRKVAFKGVSSIKLFKYFCHLCQMKPSQNAGLERSFIGWLHTRNVNPLEMACFKTLTNSAVLHWMLSIKTQWGSLFLGSFNAWYTELLSLNEPEPMFQIYHWSCYVPLSQKLWDLVVKISIPPHFLMYVSITLMTAVCVSSLLN